MGPGEDQVQGRRRKGHRRRWRCKAKQRMAAWAFVMLKAKESELLSEDVFGGHWGKNVT